MEELSSTPHVQENMLQRNDESLYHLERKPQTRAYAIKNSTSVSFEIKKIHVK